MRPSVDLSCLTPRELAKELLRHDAYRDWVIDPTVSLGEVIKAIRRGGGSMGGGWPRGYSAEARGMHILVSRAQGKRYDPPLRFTIHDIVKEMRAANGMPVQVAL